MTDALAAALREHHPPRPSSRFWFFIDEDRPPPSVRDIQNAVAEHFSVTRHDMLSNTRVKKVCIARMAGFYLCRKLTFKTHATVADLFRKCDHSISVTACKRAETLIASSQDFAKSISALEARFA